MLSVRATYKTTHMDDGNRSLDPKIDASTDLPVGRTLKAAYRAQREGGRVFPKAGEIVEMDFAVGSLGLAARKMLLLLLQKAGGDAWQDRTFSITKKELRGSHESNDRISDVLDELMNVKVKLRTTSIRNREAIMTSPLMEWNIEEVSEDGMSIVEYRFSEAARVAIAGSDYYAQIRMAVAMAFKSKYAFSLYELGSLYLRRRDRRWRGTISDLRQKIGVPADIYTNFAIFRREVLAKAKAEIDQLSDFVMTWTEIRGDGKGRPVKEVEISFEPKEPAAIEEAADELERPQVGRVARRDGSVERIVPVAHSLPDALPFPSGSLHFSTDARLNAIVADNGGGWDRDVIAEAFRNHLGSKLDTLRGPALYKAFEGFCNSFVRLRGRT